MEKKTENPKNKVGDGDLAASVMNGDNKWYEIRKVREGEWTCSCMAYRFTKGEIGRKEPCKHIKEAWRAWQERDSSNPAVISTTVIIVMKEAFESMEPKLMKTEPKQRISAYLMKQDRARKFFESEKPRVKLVGGSGNAFAILGTVSKALKKAGMKEEAEQYMKEAVGGDYDHLLRVTMEYVEVE